MFYSRNYLADSKTIHLVLFMNLLNRFFEKIRLIRTILR